MRWLLVCDTIPLPSVGIVESAGMYGQWVKKAFPFPERERVWASFLGLHTDISFAQIPVTWRVSILYIYLNNAFLEWVFLFNYCKFCIEYMYFVTLKKNNPCHERFILYNMLSLSSSSSLCKCILKKGVEFLLCEVLLSKKPGSIKNPELL